VQRAIANHYRDQFVSALAERTGEQVDIAALLPTSTAQRHLQARYPASFTGEPTEARRRRRLQCCGTARFSASPP